MDGGGGGRACVPLVASLLSQPHLAPVKAQGPGDACHLIGRLQRFGSEGGRGGDTVHTYSGFHSSYLFPQK